MSKDESHLAESGQWPGFGYVPFGLFRSDAFEHVRKAQIRKRSANSINSFHHRMSTLVLKVNGELKTSIQKGISLLVGFTHDDTEKDLDYMVNKCLNVRVYEDKERNRSWDCSVKSLNLEILVISQFTLYSKLKGRPFRGRYQFQKLSKILECSRLFPIDLNWSLENH